MKLEDLGWSSFFRDGYREIAVEGAWPARVIRASREIYTILSEKGEAKAVLSGKHRHQAYDWGDLPVVGDWVLAVPKDQGREAIIHKVLPRKSRFVRKTSGANTQQQVIAANVDTVFLVCGLDGDFNLRRIERYLTAAWESGAEPVIVLNKADIGTNTDQKIIEAEQIAFGVPVEAISASNDTSFPGLQRFLKKGKTVAFLGSSGVGKSTLVNSLLGSESLRTCEVRRGDDRGRHTTTIRQLFVIPSGAMVIDTPGMRELQLWAEDQSDLPAFADIDELAVDCKYADCSHQVEPGCAVLAALERGLLDAKRYQSYLKQIREIEYLNRRRDAVGERSEKLKNKSLAKLIKKLAKDKIKHR